MALMMSRFEISLHLSEVRFDQLIKQIMETVFFALPERRDGEHADGHDLGDPTLQHRVCASPPQFTASCQQACGQT